MTRAGLPIQGRHIDGPYAIPVGTDRRVGPPWFQTCRHAASVRADLTPSPAPAAPAYGDVVIAMTD